MDSQDTQQFFDQLRADGLCGNERVDWEALTGGVSSEIYKVSAGEKTFVVKRALRQLKVAALWEADLSRNRFEVRYLKRVSSIVPEAVPQVIYVGDGYFAMEYLGDGFTNWKSALLAGSLDFHLAARIGTIAGKIHYHTFNRPEVRADFQSLENFKQLRISPYIDYLVEKHPGLSGPLERASRELAQTAECLVHGDLSPKNILFGGDRAILLDCEVAWYGDPAFDLAFLINHLCLKTLYHVPKWLETRPLIDGFLASYFAERRMEEASVLALTQRTARLLAILLLARVDGKSPVEYLDVAKAQVVRAFSVPRIRHSEIELVSLLDDWFLNIKTLCKK